MKAMARQRSHSIAFKRQVAQEFIAGESLYALSKRHGALAVVILSTVSYFTDNCTVALKDAVDVGGGAASMAYLVRPI
jgi:hypothetical protein